MNDPEVAEDIRLIHGAHSITPTNPGRSKALTRTLGVVEVTTTICRHALTNYTAAILQLGGRVYGLKEDSEEDDSYDIISYDSGPCRLRNMRRMFLLGC